jgi:hypothetical protein
MTETNNWYTLIPENERQELDAIAKWLSPVPWQWFVTLTFSWNVRSETADLKLKRWLDAVESELRARVCFIAGKERKPDSHGMAVPWHFHLLATSDVAIPLELLVQKWKRAEGRARWSSGTQREKDEIVLVESFKQNSRGPEYCLKSINACGGDWFFRWLELFNPLMKQTGRPRHDKIRQRVRFEARQRVKQ